MRRRALLLAVMLAIAACGTSERPSADASEETVPSASAAAATDRPTGAGTAPEHAGAAPFGTVDAVGGGQIDGGELAGRDLALWFWAPW